MLSARDLGRTYGSVERPVVALAGVDLDLLRGQLLAVMGPSGSGKSTLLTIIGGLERPTSGAVEFDGQDLWTLSAADLATMRRREIGYVFQEFNLLSGLTAAENVGAPLELDGVPARAAHAEAVERLGRVGLTDRADAFPDDLSGGERQRVAIARALIGSRRLLLADEPTGSVDSATGEEIMELLRAACSPDSAVVVVTHDPLVAAKTDRIVSLQDGRLVSDTGVETGSTSPDGTSVRP